MKQIIHILGGGTFSHVRSHLALAAPAFGATARQLSEIFSRQIAEQGLQDRFEVKLTLTKMADSSSNLVTPEDVQSHLESLVAEPSTKIIVMNVAMADFHGQVGSIPSGAHAKRLESRGASPVSIDLTPAPKAIGLIRQTRKDIFAIGFKTTCGAEPTLQYTKGLRLLKENSLNLVLANDTLTRRNMIIAPEETRYADDQARDTVLETLVKMALSRCQNRFTRSTVIDGPAIPWDSPDIPANLRAVVDHCIARGAYKPFQGKTAGHFAVRKGPDQIITSLRKSNFNELDRVGMALVTAEGPDTVIAQGGRPSVGGQSQRIIFKEHPELDCIAHFHCPPRPEAASLIPTRDQWPYECGSHDCGSNTSAGLGKVDLGDGDFLKVVMLDNHGPNIVFSRSTPASKVIDFIERHFDLTAKTGGLLPSPFEAAMASVFH